MERCRVGVAKERDMIEEFMVGSCKKFKHLYCYGARKTIQKRVFEIHGVWMSIRTISRRLTELDNLGRVRRTVRNPVGRGGEKKFLSNLYRLSRKVFESLKKQGNRCWRALSFFGGPNMAHHSLASSRRDPFCGCEPVEKVLNTMKDGRAMNHFRATGETVLA